MNLKSSLRNGSDSDQTALTGFAHDRARPSQSEMQFMSPSELHNAIHYLTNDEAAIFLKLSPRTLEKQRVRGDGPRFHKFGRRVVYAIADLESWASERVCSNTAEASVLKRR
jgi:hypothetical protein